MCCAPCTCFSEQFTFIGDIIFGLGLLVYEIWMMIKTWVDGVGRSGLSKIVEATPFLLANGVVVLILSIAWSGL